LKNIAAIQQRIYTLPALMHRVAAWRLTNKTVAFTNGCFDLLHEGHLYSLSQAAKEADFLIVGVNSDNSIHRLKGKDRPINNQQSRALVLASLLIVDAVIVFEEDTPHYLIRSLLPDVLVKGGDYTLDTIVGAMEVMQNGGRVVINPVLEGFSTTNLIQKISGK